jgi:O-antigen/teichoic acid export membrane protein
VALKKAAAQFNDVMLLVSGTTISQVILVISYPFITRLFSPDAFGLLALFSSLAGILTAVISLRYEQAIVLPENDEDAANLLAGSLGLAILFSILSIPIVWFFGPSLSEWLHAPLLAQYLWLLPPVLLFGGMGTGHPALNSWATRKKKFGTLSSTRVADASVTAAGQLGAGWLGFASAGSLIGACLLGATVSPIILGAQIWRDSGKLFQRSVKLKRITAIFQRYSKFPTYNIGATLLNQVSWQIPAFMLAFFFSTDIVGFYSLGFRVLQLPMSLIGGAIGQVFFQHSAVAHVQGKLTPLIDETFHRLVLLGLFPMLTLTIVGKSLAGVFFGEAWAEAGVYIQILGIWAFAWFISAPLSNLYFVLEKQEFLLKIHLLHFVTRLISLGLGGYLGSARLALALFAGSGILVYGYLSLSILIYSGASWDRIKSIFFQAVTYFLPFGIPLFLIVVLDLGDLAVSIAAGVSFFVYGLLLWHKQPALIKSLVLR